eukprot:TRINITY_DN28163_c0_g1_i1.p1 TRINITY_DN28163_c0_g1~~TRINITY_DN28163_c0_g1_i1.p1  ORF type:complete len:369 (-),score=160.32 TRINITY_DN28163_c0_g1_i1:109-1215(-)
MAELEETEKNTTRQVAMTVQWQQRVQKLNRQMEVLQEQTEKASNLISELDKVDGDAELYSKVGRLYVKTQKGKVVMELDMQVAGNKEQLVTMRRNNKILRNELSDSEACLRELTSMEPQNSLCRAVVMFTHTHSHLSGRKVWAVFNTYTGPRLQEGPQCGIVALVVAAEAMGEQGMSVDRVMDIAMEKGFTKRGEMFSVDNMAHMALELVTCDLKVEKASKLLDTVWLVDMLLKGSVILVPYDCGPDNRPVQARGHKAHWAVISGFLLPSKTIPPHSTPLSACPGFHLLQPGTSKEDVHQVLHHTKQDAVMVVARQSKSVELGIWSRDKLVDSCRNLQEAAEKRLDGSYVLPDGGLREGLCGQVLVLG